MIYLSSLAEKQPRTYFDDSKYVGDKAMHPMLDFRTNVWQIDYDKIVVDEWIVVDKSCDMRIDTIAKFMYGTENYLDVLTKFNKISNAFDIKIGDVIAIPNISSFFQHVKKINYKDKDISTLQKSETTSAVSALKKSIAAKRSGIGLQTYKKTRDGNIIM